MIAMANADFFFEIIKYGKVVARGKQTLNTLGWDNELMTIPSTEVVLPITYSSYINGRVEIKLFVNRKVFHGIVTEYELNKIDETISVNLSHIIHEWDNNQLTTNLAIKNRTLGGIYDTIDFKYSNEWEMNYLQDSSNRTIDYVYSRQGKLQGLTKTCELTSDLFWRVGFCQDRSTRSIDIGVFGEKKPYVFSTKPSGKQNIRIITEPSIKHDFDNVINVAVVYGEKSDSGMSSMSLREVFNDPSIQDPNFPVVILNSGINNERRYDYVDFPKLAPNNDLEYAVIDTESIALEAGVVIEGSFSFNDLAPFNTNSEEITDSDRIVASKTAYEAAIKKLKQSRRTYQIEIAVEELPCDVNVGDRIRLLYDNQLLIIEECSKYMKKILSMDDWFYLTRIGYEIDATGVEMNVVTLDKFLNTNRESERQ